HEQVLLDPVIYDSDIEIIHRPASVHAGRDLARFEKMISDGDTISKRLLDIYVKELYIAGDENNYLVASRYFEKLCDSDSLDEDELVCALTIALKASIIAKDVNKQFKYALRGAATKGCSELCCELADVFYKQGDYAEAAMWYYNAAFETEPLMNIRSKKDIPLNAIINCYELMGDKDRADEFRAYL
ncbi:MAG: glycosyltransferase family 2 protein, partial [Lachnospiraceae bacterium]|nr:glycosyltransferase family 2 protein [Lachnospiraceae bacterium]